ncbi:MULTISPECIES: hypothetical protein [unclassified Archaeoglobus]|jgi:hypothetical protein|uniref:hypothetical protein n=1 Tax=unclassified Archaeoglobus TaxID=2643606 RepID=UPI0025C4540A|nr:MULTISPECIES: hypothetical protein [unclassified Archaeoglobus]
MPINATLAQELWNMTLNATYLPAAFKLLNSFIPFAILLFFGLVLLGIYLWTEDGLLPSVLALLYVALAIAPVTPPDIKASMIPPMAKPLIYTLVALSITAVIVNLIIRNRGY